MNLDTKMSARNIISSFTNMSARPEFYSGCDARECYLNDGKLESIYQAIKNEHGDDAANQFSQMVADIPKLTATDFLLNLYRLDSHGWKWDKGLLGNENGIYAGDIGSALGTVNSVLGRTHELDETSYIRGRFLQRHGIKIPECDKPRYNCYGYYLED